MEPTKAERDRERKKAWKQGRIDAGLCFRCGKVPPAEGKLDCLECYNKNLISNRASTAKRRAKCREDGTCIVCMKRKAIEGCVSCEWCQDINNTWKRDHKVWKPKKQDFIEVDPSELSKFNHRGVE